MPELFTALCLRDILRKARLEGVSPDLVAVNPAYDDDEAGFNVDPMADIRDSRMDKAERSFIEANNTAQKSIAAVAANPAAPASEPHVADSTAAIASAAPAPDA